MIISHINSPSYNTIGIFANRVINRSGTDRYSIPFFATPRWDAPVKPLIGDSALESNGEKYEQYQFRHWRRIFPIAGVSG